MINTQLGVREMCKRDRDKQRETDDDDDDDERNWIWVKDSKLLSLSSNIKDIVGKRNYKTSKKKFNFTSNLPPWGSWVKQNSVK